MLYTIQPEGANVVYSPQAVKTSDIYKWQPTKENKAAGFTRAKESGMIYLAVNDIVFSQRDSMNIDEQFKKYNLVARQEGQIDTLSSSTVSLLKDYNSYYYRDNIGQILVAVEVVRSVPKFDYNSNDTCWIFPFIWFLITIIVYFALCFAVVWGILILAYYLGYLAKKYLIR